MNSFYIKTNRTFTLIRKYGWIFTLLVAIGGLWYPKLGLLVIPIMLTLTILAFFKGRYWCGNFCPHGSLFDSLIMPITRNKKIPSFFKSKIFSIIFFLWFGFKLTRKFIKVSALIGTAQFWDKLGFIFVSSYLMVLIVGGILSIFISPRTWCNFCPMGMLQTLSYTLGKLIGITKKTDKKITICSKKMCHTCGKCSQVCPMQLTPYSQFSNNNQFNHEACIRCSTCIKNCPARILSLDNEATAIQIKEQTNIAGYEDRQKIEAKVLSIKELYNDLNEYTFKFEIPKEINYLPGQFILIKIQDNPEMYRPYSIASYNEDNTSLSVIIKKVANGYGTNIIFNNFKEGDLVQLAGPMGNELLIDKNASKILLVANGIGITPFIPIVRDMLENKNNVKDIKLIYGVRYENEFIYDEYFEKLASENQNFNYIKVVSKPNNENYKKGHVTTIMKDMNLLDYKIYMCGTKPMINDARKLLKNMGVRGDSIHYENA